LKEPVLVYIVVPLYRLSVRSFRLNAWQWLVGGLHP
jgi:hypothetical protein